MARKALFFWRRSGVEDAEASTSESSEELGSIELSRLVTLPTSSAKETFITQNEEQSDLYYRNAKKRMETVQTYVALF